MTTRTLRLIIIGAVVVAAVAAGVVILFQRAGRQAVTTSGAVTPVVVMSPAEVEAKYRQGLSQATATLKPLLARQLTVADQAQVAAVRDSLASLRVPVSVVSVSPSTGAEGVAFGATLGAHEGTIDGSQ